MFAHVCEMSNIIVCANKMYYIIFDLPTRIHLNNWNIRSEYNANKNCLYTVLSLRDASKVSMTIISAVTYCGLH